jgi:UDP:flavonoid glycosyltransferase YjiC (YdhE family)
MNRMKTRKLSSAIEQLTQRQEYESNARAFGQRVSEIDGAKNALRLFERLEGRLQAKKSLSMATS